MLTRPKVEQAKPKRTAYVIWDEELPGFGCHIYPSGQRTFFLQYRPKGSRRVVKQTLGRYGIVTLHEARAQARQALAQRELGQDPQAHIRARQQADIARANRLTVTMLVNRYLTALHAGAATAYARPGGKLTSEYMRDVARNLGHFAAVHGKRDADGITRGEVQTLLDSWAHSPATARRLHFMVRRMYTWASQRDIVPSNPALLATSSPSPPRERWLSLDEMARIWHAADYINPLYRDAVRMLMITGQRRGKEVGGMLWGEIDCAQALWTIPAERMKMRRVHTVPLAPLALEILHQRRSALRKLPPAADDYVFASLSRDHRSVVPVQGWERIQTLLVERSNITGWVLHDFRRSLVTNCSNAGGDEWTLDRMISHARTGVMSVYQRATSIDQFRAEMARWNSLLTAAIDPPAKNTKVVPLRA